MDNFEYTVESIISLYSKSMTTSFDEQIITLEGFYQQTGNKSYNGVYYDTLFDEDKQHKLTLVVKERQRKSVVTGQYYRFQGYLNRYDRNSKDGAFQLIYRVTKVIDQLDEHQFITKEEFDLVRARFDRPSVDIQGMLLDILRKNEKPHITVILGSTSIVDEDYKSEMNECKSFVINEHRIPFNSHGKLINTLKVSSNTDLLVCMRGGGSGLEIFDQVKVAEEALKLKVPFVTAIGHKEDITMLERVADKGFATPTAFGSFLRKIEAVYLNEINKLQQRESDILKLNTKINELTENQKKLAEHHQEDKRQLESLFKEERLENKNLIKRLWIVVVLLAVFFVYTLFLLFK